MAAPPLPGITKRFADFSVAIRYEDLPADVIAEAKNGILDTLGVALIGSREESTRMILNACVNSTTGGKATVLGRRTLATPTVAALVNGYAAHTLNYDDSQHNVETTHMSAPVLPAALALAEIEHRSGKDLLVAYVTGFEIGCRLGRAGRFAPHLSRRGINPNGVLGHFGAAGAAGKLIGLNALQMTRNFGIVAGHAAGLMTSSGTMAKAQQAGNAAQNGVLSTLLARLDFTGPEEIFDGEQNIFSIYDAQTDPEELFRDLGRQFEITSNTLKPFACAGWRNPIMAASMWLAATHNLRLERIKDINVWACADQIRLPNYAEPRIGLEAKFSAQYAAAVAVVDRAGGVAQFTDERVADPALKHLTRRVTLGADQELGPFQTRVVIHTTDGRELSHFIPVPKGDHLNPLCWDELVAKFSANALTVLPPRQVERLIAMIRDLEAVGDVAELMRFCRSGDGPIQGAAG